MSFGLVQLGQAATSLEEADLAYRCLIPLVNHYWLHNLASMHNYKSLFNMDISGGMPAVIIKMLVASDPGKIQLLPALPDAWPKGTIEGVLCRGQIEIKSLQWEKDRILVSVESGKKQQVIFEVPSNIRDAMVRKGQGTIAETDKDTSRLVSLLPDQEVTIEFILR